jgi:hypothetical protein
MNLNDQLPSPAEIKRLEALDDERKALRKLLRAAQAAADATAARQRRTAPTVGVVAEKVTREIGLCPG